MKYTLLLSSMIRIDNLFFFQAKDGIRDIGVTGVQTCALPIWGRGSLRDRRDGRRIIGSGRARVSKVHNALIRRLPHRAKAPVGLARALAPGSEPAARREAAGGDFCFPSLGSEECRAG